MSANHNNLIGGGGWKHCIKTGDFICDAYLFCLLKLLHQKWFRFSSKGQRVTQITIGRTWIWTLSQALLVTRWCVCVFPFIVNPYRQQPTFQREAKAPKLTADDLLTGTSVRLLFVIPFYCCGGQVWVVRLLWTLNHVKTCFYVDVRLTD